MVMFVRSPRGRPRDQERRAAPSKESLPMQRHDMHAAIKVILGIVLFAATVACGPVPAWDRGKLAHPTMTAEEISFGLDGHVRAVSEGATGGMSGAGGGCGCN